MAIPFTKLRRVQVGKFKDELLATLADNRLAVGYYTNEAIVHTINFCVYDS